MSLLPVSQPKRKRICSTNLTISSRIGDVLIWRVNICLSCPVIWFCYPRLELHCTCMLITFILFIFAISHEFSKAHRILVRTATNFTFFMLQNNEIRLMGVSLSKTLQSHSLVMVKLRKYMLSL